MGDVANATPDNCTCVALALAGLCVDASHVLNAWHSVNHDHIAWASQVVGLKLSHFVHMPARGLVNMLALHDVTHRQRGSHDARTRKGGLQYRCADDTGNTQLVHHVGNNASRVSKGAKPFDDPFRRPRRFYHANPLAGDFPSQLFFSHRSAPSPLLTELSLRTLVSFGSQLIKNRQIDNLIRAD